jgi:hypothetical protein
MEEAIRMMDDDCAQRGDCPVEGLTERHLFLLREVYAESLEPSIRQSEEFKMFRGV